jgi:hypothetical protein
MLAKIDHPQYHLRAFAAVARPARRALTDEERARYVWRNGVKVRKA